MIDEKLKNERLGMSKLMSCGEVGKIIEYFKSKNITVLFEDGTIVKNKNFSDFEKGHINKGKRISVNKHKSIIGNKYGKLTVISLNYRKKNGHQWLYYYDCECECGNKVIRDNKNLTRKTYRHSCGNCINTKKENTIKYNYPNLIKYFKNKEDLNYSVGSHKKVEFVCPDCKKETIRMIKLVTRNGYNCPYCKDTLSYPEKYLRNFISQLKIEYEVEKKFYWSNNKRYDFYIPSINCIIETNGSQHYQERGFSHVGGRTLKEEQENDIYKKNLAINNGIINYIQLDCSVSNSEYIKNSILKSDISKLINIQEINYDKCSMFACSNMFKLIFNEWNNMEYKNTTIIANKYKVSRRMVSDCLKTGNELGLCKYDPKKSIKYRDLSTNNTNNKKIKCITINEEFRSIKECVRQLEDRYNTRFLRREISSVLNGKRNEYKGFVFEYVN